MRVDHVILLVEDLDAWTERFRGAGFTVSDRLDLDGTGPQHRLVCFGSGTYLELIHVSPGDPHAPGWVDRVRPAGDAFGAWSVNAADLDAVFKLLPGTDGEPVHEGGNRVPVVGEWRMRVASPRLDTDLIAPFVIQDLTGAEGRVPAGDARTHRNGIVGLATVRLAVSDPRQAAERLSPALGEPAPVAPVPWSAGPGVSLNLGDGQTLELYAARSGTAENSLVATRGEGVAELVLTADGAQPRPDLAALSPFNLTIAPEKPARPLAGR